MITAGLFVYNCLIWCCASPLSVLIYDVPESEPQYLLNNILSCDIQEPFDRCGQKHKLYEPRYLSDLYAGYYLAAQDLSSFINK